MLNACNRWILASTIHRMHELNVYKAKQKIQKPHDTHTLRAYIVDMGTHIAGYKQKKKNSRDMLATQWMGLPCTESTGLKIGLIKIGYLRRIYWRSLRIGFQIIYLDDWELPFFESYGFGRVTISPRANGNPVEHYKYIDIGSRLQLSVNVCIQKIQRAPVLVCLRYSKYTIRRIDAEV